MLHMHKMELSQEVPWPFSQYLQTRTNFSSNCLCSTQQATITKTLCAAAISGKCVSQSLRRISRSKTEFCELVPSRNACWLDTALIIFRGGTWCKLSQIVDKWTLVTTWLPHQFIMYHYTMLRMAYGVLRVRLLLYRRLQCDMYYEQYMNPFGPGAGHLQFSTPFIGNVNILWIKKGNIRKYTAFCGGINEDGKGKSKKIIKYICWLNI